MTDGAVRVVIADDDPSIRSALSDLVATDPQLEVVGVAADANEAIALADRHHPDVAILDVRMPGGGGPHAAREIKRRSPQTRVIALSAYDDRTTVLDMVRAGATGYLVKGGQIGDILATIHSTVRGLGALSAEVTGDIVDALAEQLQREEREDAARREAVERIEGVLAGPPLTMAYQPIVHLQSGAVVGVEALARFEHEPRRGPDAWFAEAGTVGLLADLERWASPRRCGTFPGFRKAPTSPSTCPRPPRQRPSSSR